MALSSELTSQMNMVIKAITPAVLDIQARTDYAKNDTASETATTLESYRLAIETLLTKPSPTSTDIESLETTSTKTVLPALTALTEANIAMINMGQLSTDRTIMPSVAKAENVLLAAVSDATTALAALLANADLSTPGPDPETISTNAAGESALGSILAGLQKQGQKNG